MTGGTRPTQADVARLAGVSRQTVSLVVLSDPRVSERSRKAVRAAMETLGYRPNVAARALASSRTGFLGIVLNGLANPFHAELAEALRRSGDEHGFIPFVSPVDQDQDEEAVAVGRFVEMAVDGLILVSPLLDSAQLARIGVQVPTVVLTRNAGPDEVDLVHSDDWGGAREVTQHLMDGGYRPVLYLGYDRRVEGDSSAARLEGYRSVLAERGLNGSVVDVRLRPVGHVVREVAHRYGSGFGLVCHNDLVALQAWGSLTEIGLVPGRDAGVAGFDDTDLAAFPGVGLTSVNHGTSELAANAIAMIEQRIAGRHTRREVVLPARLVARRSTRHTL